MRVLVVEDEPVVARRLSRMIREIVGDELEHLEVEGLLHDAFDRLAETPVDLLFLDLNLHGQDGFELLRQVVASSFHTIVVSAHVERAVEAFELGVLDFVPKPFSRKRLQLALDRARKLDTGPRSLRYLAIRRSGSTHLIPIDQVSFIQAADDYAEIHTRDGQVALHDKTLSKLEDLLPEHFLRVHRSYLVNLRDVRRLGNEPGSRYFIELEGGQEIPVGRTRLQALRRRWI